MPTNGTKMVMQITHLKFFLRKKVSSISYAVEITHRLMENKRSFTIFIRTTGQDLKVWIK